MAAPAETHGAAPAARTLAARRGQCLGAKSRLALRTFCGECVGTFIANIFCLGVIFSTAFAAKTAQGHTLLDTAAGLALPPGAAGGVPPLVPDSAGPMDAPDIPGGKGAVPVGHLYVVFPSDGVFVAMGIAMGYGVALMTCPGNTLNPTFTVAVSVLEKAPWFKIPSAIIGQMLGGVLACATMYCLGSDIFAEGVPHGDGYQWAAMPKTVETAGMFGVPQPNEVFSQTIVVCSTVFFTAFLVLVTLPAFAGTMGDMHPLARPWIIALVIAPYVLATSSLGVQNNAALFVSGLIFCTLAGWPSSLWNGYALIVIIGPLVGALIGVALVVLWASLMIDPKSPLAPPEETADNTNLEDVECSATLPLASH